MDKDDAYDNLKRALRVEIDEDAWSSRHNARSLTVEQSEIGRIAVKFINHYGDAVLKVYNSG